MAFNLGQFLVRLISLGLAGNNKPRPSQPPPQPAPSLPTRWLSASVRDPDGVGISGVDVTLAPDNGPSITVATDGNGRAAFSVPGTTQGGASLRADVNGYKHLDQRYVLPVYDSELDPPFVTLERDVVQRTGVARIVGRRFADAQGGYLAVGTSLFWAPWGYRNDPGRTEQNLAYVQGRTDYVRMIACVAGPSWEDRATTANDILDTDCIAGVADMAYRHGQRVHWTIFGGSPETAGSAALREAVVRRVCDQLAPRRHTIQFVEIANEENDFRFAGGRDELIRLARIAQQLLPGVDVALTSPVSTGDFVAFNSGSPTTIASCHLDRSVNGTGGLWRPTRQARDCVDIPQAWVHGEPIGIDSSVAADDDPTRLAMTAAATWVCRGAAYTLHTGAGIRGGGAADLARGRKANLWDQPRFDACLNQILTVRAALYEDTPNGSWQNGNSRFPLFPFELPYDDNGTHIVAPEDQLLRAFASLLWDGRFVVVGLAVNGTVKFIPKRAMTFEHRDGAGLLVQRVSAGAGQPYEVNSGVSGPGLLFVGRFQ